jgi:quinol monooxygenase YgiN
VLDPGLIHINERWESRAHLDAHMKTAHFATWRDAGARLGVGERNLAAYEVGAPMKL